MVDLCYQQAHSKCNTDGCCDHITGGVVNLLALACAVGLFVCA